MPAIDRQQLDHLERRGFQLTIFSAIFVLVLAGGLATFMYPLDLFGLVLPETDSLNAKRIAVRLNEELQAVRARHGTSFDLTTHNYPDQVKSSHELEDIVKSMLPEEEGWDVPAEAPTT